MVTVKTLVVGYVPPADTAGKKSAQLRNDAYMRDLFGRYDLGELEYAPLDGYREKLLESNPIIVITFGEYYAKEISQLKKDIFIYVVYDAWQIFYRKSEREKRESEQDKKFEEIAGLIQKIRDDGEEEMPMTRKIAAMDYKDTYEMVIQMLISDREDLSEKAWELLNSKDSTFVWMRAKLMCEIWEGCDGKKREEFLCHAMDQHIENGMAHKIHLFTDEDGQVFHQYMFHYVDGSDTNYIRRIPIAFKGQEKYTYQALLDKYETPNGVRLLLEAGQLKSKKDEYIKDKAAQVLRVLQTWKADPVTSKKALGVLPLIEGTDYEPLGDQELINLQSMLKAWDRPSFDLLFLDDVKKEK